jgi:uncharacterized SAM-binding protein YcdF (DUF218 family)
MKMFFFLSKTLNILISPLSWIIIILAFALLVKKPGWRKKLVISALSLLVFFSNSFIFNEVAIAWEVPAHPVEQMDVHDLAIVLGGTSSYDDEIGRMQAFRGFDRVVQARNLYYLGYFKKMLFTGGSGSIIYPEMKEGYYIRHYLLTTGFPEEALIIEGESKNTRENAVFSKELLREKGYENPTAILITSGYHMRRAKNVFEKAGFHVNTFSTDRLAGPRRFDVGFLLVPSPEIFFNWEYLIKEWVGMIAYAIMGYI